MGFTGFQRLALASAIAVLAGCAAQRAAEPLRPAGGDPARNAEAIDDGAGLLSPGRVAVVAVRYPPEARYGGKAQGKAAGALGGAAIGAGVGALFGALMWAQAPDLERIARVLAPITIVAGALIGAAAGAAAGVRHGMRSEYVDALHRPVEQGLREGSLHDALARRLVEEGAGLPHYELTYYGAAGPASDTEAPRYGELKDAGFDSVLEVAVTSVGFEANRGDPHSVAFDMRVRTRVVPLGRRDAPPAREFTRRGEWRSVTAWASDDGRLWRHELDEAQAGLAREVSGALLWPLSAE